MAKTLYLIDGYAQIFRAYYAIGGGMHSPITGEPTHVVFGFTAMLLKLFQQFQPEYVAVAIDSPGKTFRDALYPEYKATRAVTPDDLKSQIPRVFEVVEAFGIPLVGAPGIEADDVIATITQRILDDPACADVEIRIFSRDKDLEQLLGERVTMVDIHTDTVTTVATLRETKGIAPEQVVDVLALMGDSVDNIPGVAGIGPKTAAQLVQQFGSIEGILANLDQIKGKRRENLEQARSILPLSRALVTLKRDADLPFTLEQARVRPLDLARLLHLFQQLGFRRFQEEVKSLAERLGVSAPKEGAVQATLPVDAAEPATLAAYTRDGTDYRAITRADELEALVATLRAQPMIAVDTETTGLGRNADLVGLSFSWAEGQGVYVPVRSPAPERHLDRERVLGALAPVLADERVPKCAHNAKFDAAVLLREGVRLRGVVFDSMLASLLMDPAQPAHKLDALAERQLGYRMIPIADLIGGGNGERTAPRPMDAVPLDQVTIYAAEDADIALRLYHRMLPQIEALGMRHLLQEVESPLATVLAEMEANGITCDPEELRRQGEDLRQRAHELRERIQQIAGVPFNVDSPSQLAEVLFDRLGLRSIKRTKTGRSTDIEVLERLAAEEDRNDPRTSVPRLVIEYRQLAKLISTYLEALRQAIDPRTGRIHTTYHQLVTATGRLASHNPNMQNIPVRTDIGRQVRKAFVAAPGHRLICADYSQVELRLLAHLSGDSALIEAFQQDRDIHATVAAEVFGVPIDQVTREQRDHAKTINFGIIYGVTPYGLARRIEGLDVEAATRLIADYKRRFPGIERFLARCVREAIDHGYVTTILGRRRAIPEVHSSHAGARALGERLAINTVVQGSAADLIKVAMVNLQRRIDREGLPLRLLLQIHDELVLETPADRAEEHAALVREEMERALTLRVPLKAEAGIGDDWMSAK